MRAPDRPPETRTNYVIPTDFYKAEDSNVFSPDLFGSVFASYQHADYTEHSDRRPRQGHAVLRQLLAQHLSVRLAKEPQKQANLQVSKFFNTGRINHELKFSFNYRQQIADSASGLPGSQNGEVDDTFVGSPDCAAISRGVRKIFETQFWSGTLGDTLTTGNLTVAAGVRYDLQQAKNLPGTSFANAMFANPCTNCGADGGSFPGLPEVKYHGAKDWQFQFTNWQPRVSATYALGEKKNTLLRASYARFVDQLGSLAYYLSGDAGQNGYFYDWTDLNHDHNVQPNEVLFNELVGYFNGIDPAALPDASQPDPAGLQDAGDQRGHGRRRASAHRRLRGLRHVLLPKHEQPSESDPDRIEPLDLRARRPGDRQRHAPTASRSTSTSPSTTSRSPRRRPASTLTNRPGRHAEVLRSGRVGRQTTLQELDGARQLRLEQLPAVSDAPVDPESRTISGISAARTTTAVSPAAGRTESNVCINASWQFNVNGLYQGPWGLTFGANFFGRQGYPNPYFVSVQTHDVASSTPLILIGKVDTYRYANVYELDLRLQKTFQIGPVTRHPHGRALQRDQRQHRPEQRPERRLLRRREAASSMQDPYFNQIIEVQSPRIVRLGLQVNF